MPTLIELNSERILDKVMGEAQLLNNRPTWSSFTHVLHFHVSEQDAAHKLLRATVIPIPSGEITVRLLNW